MRLRGIGRLQRWLRRALAPLRPQIVILLYHRVLEASSDPQLLCVRPRHFIEHLEYLRRHYSVVSLGELIEGLKNGASPKQVAVITFDDGYADNLWNARPILERHAAPATVFVTTGYLGAEREFWWDELDRLLLQPGSLPERLELSIDGRACEWDLGASARYQEKAYESYRCWHVERRGDPSRRHSLYRLLCQRLRPLSEKERQRVLDALRMWASVYRAARPTHRALTPDELARLAEDGLIEIGAHTVTHPVLSTLSVEEQRAEIAQSKAQLEGILGYPVTGFAYPYGTPADYTRETIFLVRDSGFTWACSNFPGLVSRRTDPFQLPRILVRDWDGDEFARHMRIL